MNNNLEPNSIYKEEETFVFECELSEKSNKNNDIVKPKKSAIGEIYSEYLGNKRFKKKKKKKKRKKEQRKYDMDYDDCYHYFNVFNCSDCSLSEQEKSWNDVPEQMLLNMRFDPGFVFGLKNRYGLDKYVGMSQDTEGNILVIGGNGSGKSSSIAKPTLITWNGAMCVTDIKGELSDFYAELFKRGLVNRPFLIFDPIQINGIGYDPFYWLLKDSEENLVSNIWEITIAIIPNIHNDYQPFWIESEQSILAAALIYYFKIGLSFSETMIMIVSSTVTTLCHNISAGDNKIAKMFLGEIVNMKPETLANFDRGLRNKLMLFATDPYINHAFCGIQEGASCFTWDDLDTYNIFLRIPADRIEQWGGAINLMYTQLIRHLERLPDKYSPEGRNNIQTLLLMDEFARFGKLEMITNAMSTLRSKSVNICLMIQSMAQLDNLYGEYDRRIIFDNCQYQAILRTSDAETQKYISELIGTNKGIMRGLSENLDEFMNNIGYSKQINESRQFRIFPHELSTLKDILLLTPYGFFRIEKIQMHNNEPNQMLSFSQIIPSITSTAVTLSEQQENACKVLDEESNVIYATDCCMKKAKDPAEKTKGIIVKSIITLSKKSKRS